MGISIKDPRVIVRTGDKLIADKRGFRRGKNGSLDIKLIHRNAGL